MSNVAQDLVVIETMPEQHRASHRAAGNWGSYPHNGAVREVCGREVADEIVAEDNDGYDHIVRDASERDVRDLSHHSSVQLPVSAGDGQRQGGFPGRSEDA